MDDMEKFEEKEMIKKILSANSSGYNWLINYIAKIIKERWAVLKTKL